MMPPSTHDIIPAREVTSNDHPTTSRESENDDIPPLAERLTAAETRKRARADAGGEAAARASVCVLLNGQLRARKSDARN